MEWSGKNNRLSTLCTGTKLRSREDYLLTLEIKDLAYLYVRLCCGYLGYPKCQWKGHSGDSRKPFRFSRGQPKEEIIQTTLPCIPKEDYLRMCSYNLTVWQFAIMNKSLWRSPMGRSSSRAVLMGRSRDTDRTHRVSYCMQYGIQTKINNQAMVKSSREPLTSIVAILLCPGSSGYFQDV